MFLLVIFSTHIFPCIAYFSNSSALDTADILLLFFLLIFLVLRAQNFFAVTELRIHHKRMFTTRFSDNPVKQKKFSC